MESNIQRKLINWKPFFIKELKFLSLRMPSLILADLFLANIDYFYDDINDRFKSIFNYLILLIIYNVFIAFGLLVCLLLFSLNKNYVIRIYKIGGLVSLPFLFTFLIEYAHQGIRVPFLNFNLPPLFLICLVYAFISSATITLYNDIYINLICDKYNIHTTYLRDDNYNYNDNNSNNYYNSQNVDDYIERINNEQSEDKDVHLKNEDNDIVPTIFTWLIANKRRIYILTYSILGLVVNEFSYFLSPSIKHNEEDTPLNIVSLGYLLLLTYDLSVNLDQILLRILRQTRIFREMINEYGLNNFLSFNWFERLRVPHVLRIYFLFKSILFTLKFIFYFNYYFDLNLKMNNQNLTENYSLFNSIANLFKIYSSNLTINDYDGANTNIEKAITNSVNIINENLTDDKIPNLLITYFVSIGFNYLNGIKDITTTSTFLFDTNLVKFDINLKSITCLYLKMLLINLSNNIISIASITSVLSYKFFLFGCMVNKIISLNSNDQNNNNRRARFNHQRNNHNNQNAVDDNINEFVNVGDVAAILFFLLSIQSGLSSLNGNQRVEKFLKNYSLLFIAILHYLHTGLDSQLTTISASSNPHWFNKKHLRLLLVCFSLILLPAVILFILWTNFKISTWLLAASAFNIELIVKMSVSLLLYGLFLFDSKRIKSAYDKLVTEKKDNTNNTIDELSDNLDDYIYYVKAFGHIVEFLVALFLLFNGAYILLFESYGAVRAVMMCIHAYFHIWCQAKKGWSVYMKRRTAVSKLKQLLVFNRTNFINIIIKKQHSDNNNNNNDVDYDEQFDTKSHDYCAICYCELYIHEARITNCNHIFHMACLRKWLYLSDQCPMCHQLVYQPHPASTPN